LEGRHESDKGALGRNSCADYAWDAEDLELANGVGGAKAAKERVVLLPVSSRIPGV
jgi:hypothetical protein